jgi:hypothetical protein
VSNVTNIPVIKRDNGEPPYDGGMDLGLRVGNLEIDVKDVRDRLGRVEVKLDAVSTKAEVHDLKAEMIKWIVGTAIGLGVAAITVFTFVLNNATPKGVAPQSAQPIVIYVPVQPAPAVVTQPAK